MLDRQENKGRLFLATTKGVHTCSIVIHPENFEEIANKLTALLSPVSPVALIVEIIEPMKSDGNSFSLCVRGRRLKISHVD